MQLCNDDAFCPRRDGSRSREKSLPNLFTKTIPWMIRNATVRRPEFQRRISLVQLRVPLAVLLIYPALPTALILAWAFEQRGEVRSGPLKKATAATCSPLIKVMRSEIVFRYSMSVRLSLSAPQSG